MSAADRWLLPDAVEEALPERARRLEVLRRRLLDLYAGWGYDLVMPPLIEFLDSLLCGAGPDLSLQTFRLTDQLSGRALGVRADITPQVARMDAHSLGITGGVRRLCYAGSVLHARPAALTASRIPLQAGAELFGHAGPEADVEVISLMLETLAAVGRRDVHLDLGHVGIYRGLVATAGLDANDEALLFDILQRKAIPELDAFLAERVGDVPVRGQLRALATLYGGAAVPDRAREVLVGAGDTVQAALAALVDIGRRVQQRYPHIEVCYDLGELRGYRYHTGCAFAAYVPGRSQDVARGGRYDEIGAVFGAARPATGFSTDIKTLAELVPLDVVPAVAGIFADVAAGDTAVGRARIAALRADGERVVCALPGQGGADAGTANCDRRLVPQGDDWIIVPA